MPIIILVIVIFALLGIGYWQSRPREKPIYQVIATTNNIDLLWAKDEMGTNKPTMIANNDRIFFPKNGLSAYESRTGKWLWRVDIQHVDQLYATENLLYFTAHKHAPGSHPYIGAIDVNNGSINWRGRSIGTVKNIRLNFVDELLYASADGYRLYDSYTGDLLFKGDSSMRKEDENGRWFLQPPDQILEKLPPSYDGRKFFSSNHSSNYIKSGLWEYDRLLSNEVGTDQITWGVTVNGTLEGIHIPSGETQYSVKFSTEEFTHDAGGGYTNTYQVIINEAGDLVFVWFSSSEQLFAFSVLDS